MDGGFLLCDREIMMDSTNPQSRVLRVPDSDGEVLCQERSRDKRESLPLRHAFNSYKTFNTVT